MAKDKKEEYREEAERLAQLPEQDQAAVVAMYRHLAANPLATKSCRADAERKAAALERLLCLSRKPAKASAASKAGKGIGQGAPEAIAAGQCVPRSCREGSAPRPAGKMRDVC